MPNKNLSIPDQLNIFQYKSYSSIPCGKIAWITIKAKQQGKDPDKVHAQIERKMGGSKKGNKKTTKTYQSKKVRKKTTRSKSNMYSLSVKQWNPFMGCKFDCIYCESSFKRQAKRQKNRCMKCYNYKPHTHPNRLNEYLPRTNNNEFIFTCSSGDIAFCSTPYLRKIINRIEKEEDKTFLIQSKDPKTFGRVIFPENVILGTTIETNRDKYKISKAPKTSKRFKDFLKIKHTLKMITVEPVLDFDLDVMLRWIKQIKPCVVWLGFDSKNNDLPGPDLKKFNRLYRDIKKAGIKVILKTVRENL